MFLRLLDQEIHFFRLKLNNLIPYQPRSAQIKKKKELTARTKYRGSQNSLDALCKRFNIDNSRREKHSALVDCELLKEVYINLLDQKEPKLNLQNLDMPDIKMNNKLNKVENVKTKIIEINNEELELHKKFLKTSLQKNYFK